MQSTTTSAPANAPVSKLKLALGAASLFLFIVGLKRTFDMEDASGSREGTDAPAAGRTAEPAAGRTSPADR